jgi:lactate racemase
MPPSIPIHLGYGRAPLLIQVPPDSHILQGQDLPPQPEDITQELARTAHRAFTAALASPIAAPRLRGRLRSGSQVVIVVSDATRDEPRDAMVRAVLEEIDAPMDVTLAVANGTHPPGPIDALGLSSDLLARVHIYNHDSTAGSHFVDLGTTARGTRVRLPRFLLDADLVVATGRIRPHYFAGYGAGAKAIFPGLGCREDIRQNHLLKRHPTSRLGRAMDNACRDDLEDAARLLPIETHLLNAMLPPTAHMAPMAPSPAAAWVGGPIPHNSDKQPAAANLAVAGDVVQAFRVGVARCAPQYETAAQRADIVITSDTLPLTGSLYQASKLLAPAGMLLRPGGIAILAAECPDGTGPLEVVNEGIYRLGIRHFFPEAHTIYLVSSLPEATVAQTYCRYAPTVEAVLSAHRGRVAVLPAAGNVIPVVTDGAAP